MKKIMLALWVFWGWTAMALAAEPLHVVVSIPPQKFFVQEIGGNLVDVMVMVPPGSDPHNYEPKPRQMVALSKAAGYLSVGISFEDAWLDRFKSANSDLKFFHIDQGIQKIRALPHDHDHGAHDAGHQEDHEADHDAEKEAEHHHDDHEEALDNHVWTSPLQAQTLAKNTFLALVEMDPDHRAEYEAGYEKLNTQLKALDAKVRKTFEGRQGMKFMVFHPAWGYLARDYGLVQVPIQLEGKEPKPAQLEALIREAREEGVRVVFVQPQMSKKSAQTVAQAIGGVVIEANPLAEDYLRNIEDQVEKINRALN